MKWPALIFGGFALFLAACGEAPVVETNPVESEPAPAPAAPVGAYAQVCIACHGPNGEGKEELHSPSIAGLPTWYVEEQVKNSAREPVGFIPRIFPGSRCEPLP
jgi:cytochrome c553